MEEDRLKMETGQRWRQRWRVCAVSAERDKADCFEAICNLDLSPRLVKMITVSQADWRRQEQKQTRAQRAGVDRGWEGEERRDDTTSPCCSLASGSQWYTGTRHAISSFSGWGYRNNTNSRHNKTLSQNPFLTSTLGLVEATLKSLTINTGHSRQWISQCII